MTKEKAEEEIKRINAEPFIAFCPLINGPCQKDCVCLQLAHVFKFQNEFYVETRKCSNYMFRRKIQE